MQRAKPRMQKTTGQMTSSLTNKMQGKYKRDIPTEATCEPYFAPDLNKPTIKNNYQTNQGNMNNQIYDIMNF